MALGTPAIPSTGGGGGSDVNLVEVGGAPIQLGQQIDGESIPVVLPADQITALTPIGNITNYALETGGNLASIKSNTDKIPSLGQALAAGSVPVVLTALQLAALTPLSSVAVTQSTSPWVISGSVTANAGTDLNTSLLALESGGNLASIKTNTDKIPSLGQALAAGSVPIVLTAAQLTTLTPPAALTNYALETGGNLAAAVASLSVLDDWDESDRAKVNPIAGQAGVAGGSGVDSALTQRVSLATNVALPAGSNVIGHIIADTGSTTAATQATAANLNAQVVGPGGDNAAAVGNPVRVAGADGVNTHTLLTDSSGRLILGAGSNVIGTVITKQSATTAAVTSVDDVASSTTLLASNANRLGATIYNDSTVALYVKLGTTATVTDFTVQMNPEDYYEVPFGYTGRIDGIWASNASGAAKMTEISA